jgi:hypothetical protein
VAAARALSSGTYASLKASYSLPTINAIAKSPALD